MGDAWWFVGRLLISQKKSRSFSFLTLISGVSLALSLTAMIVVLSVMEGFEREQKKRLYQSEPHVVIPGEHHIEDSRILKSTHELRRDMLATHGRFVSGITMVGDDLVPNGQAWVSDQLAVTLRLENGSEFLIQDLSPDPGLMGAAPRSLPLKVSQIISELPVASEFEVHLPKNLAVAFAKNRGIQTVLKTTTLETALELTQEYQGQGAKSWRDRNATLFFSLRLERIAMGVLLGFIVLVASFSIVSSTGMLAMEKKDSMAVLRAIGLPEREQERLFLKAGLMIGSLGVIGGLMLSLGICFVLRYFHFVKLPDVYVDRSLPVAFEFVYFVGPMMLASVLTLVASFFPSRLAARGISLTDGLKGK